MATTSISELIALAEQIRTNSTSGSNTNELVGSTLKAAIETLASFVGMTVNEIKGYTVIESTSELPEDPTDEEQMIGYLLDTMLYVYVGTGGDTLDGKYKGVDLKGEQGVQGVPGQDGVSLGEVPIDDVPTAGSDNPVKSGGVVKALTASLNVDLASSAPSTGYYTGDVGETAALTSSGGYYGIVSIEGDKDYSYTWNNAKSSSATIPYYLLFTDDDLKVVAQAAPKDTSLNGEKTVIAHAPATATKAIVMSSGNSSTSTARLFLVKEYQVTDEVERLIPETRLEIIDVKYNPNGSTYIRQLVGTYCIKVYEHDKIQVENLTDYSWSVFFAGTKPALSGGYDMIGTVQSIRNTGIIVDVPAACDGKYLIVSGYARQITDDVRITLNGQNLSSVGVDEYPVIKDKVVESLQSFTISATVEQGGLGSASDTTSARLRYPIYGRCIVSVDDDYYIDSVYVYPLNSSSRSKAHSVNVSGLNSSVMTFNYDAQIRLDFRRKDGAVISASEYAGIITGITPAQGERPTSHESSVVFPLCAPDVTYFIENVTYTNDYTDSYVATALNNGTFNTLPFERCLPVRLDWTPLPDTKNYIIILDTQSGGGVTPSNTPYFSKENHIDIYNLLPSTNYNYAVFAVLYDGTTRLICYEKFSTGTLPLRIINLSNTTNVRDLGGWSAANNKKVKYGRLFRGAAMSRREGYVIDSEGIEQACRFLHIAKEIGLGVGYPASPITGTTQFVDISVSAYYRGATESGANYVRVFGEIMATLSANTTDSVLYHCAGGADRTGTLSWLLLGLLGVSESDMSKDYELTSYTKSANRRVRNSSDFVGLVDYINTFAGSTINEKIEAWWLANGATAAQITSFRNLMLE
ncbi:MAG: tyrosine-protein phosphatase [Bacteroidaceae bacterium]|nr:tyrosine-protein phosphatase [Bacteroidaceae bacterium]